MRILITGGGTGGHINPAIAIGSYIKKLQPSWEVAFVGDPDKMEGRMVPAAGFRLYPIKMDGIDRTLSLRSLRHNIRTLQEALNALSVADGLISNFKPDLCIGVGGYVSWPLIRQAQKRGVKTMIHEQNTFPGVTTKTLARRADVVLLPNAKAGERLARAKKKVVVGNPVRDEFIYGDKAAARAKLGLAEGERLVVSVGGSLGARELNRAMARFFPLSITLENCSFVHGTGRGGYKAFCAELDNRRVKYNNGGRIAVKEFIDEMDVYMTAADVYISRAGAATLAELAVCGTPAVLVPSPNVTENHQFHNAKLIEKNGGAVVITEDQLTAQLLYDTVRQILCDGPTNARMRKAMQSMAIYDACDRIYEQIKLIAR